jgi:DeoR family suf operon transcriptional repressor
MKKPESELRESQSTRGRIVALLRGGVRTVQALAEALDVSPGAVRVHLTNLERDGIVQLGSAQKGFRKPFQTYELTEEAEHAMSRAYAPVLAMLVNLLERRISKEELQELLCLTGRSLAARHGEVAHGTISERTRNAVNKLNSLGGNAHIEETEDQLVIRTSACPLRTVTTGRPEACCIATCMLAELIGSNVSHECDHSGSPRCRFVVSKHSSKAK